MKIDSKIVKALFELRGSNIEIYEIVYRCDLIKLMLNPVNIIISLQLSWCYCLT